MTVGDLVWHVDDIRDGCATPGIVTRLVGGDDATVQFTDRDHQETHPQHELRLSPLIDDDENIMGNP